MTILDLLNKYGIELTKQGSLFVAFCPFHRDENRPNFTVYPATDSYFCYTCSKGGDAIAFLAAMENITREQASFRMYSDLSFLLDKLNKTPEEAAYNDTVALQVANHFRSFLFEKPSLLSDVKNIMKDVDLRLSKPVSRQDAINIVLDVSTRLNDLRV